MPEVRTDIKQSLKDVGKTIADLCRESDINYKRLSGLINGYWCFRSNESHCIELILEDWANEKSGTPKIQSDQICDYCVGNGSCGKEPSLECFNGIEILKK